MVSAVAHVKNRIGQVVVSLVAVSAWQGCERGGMDRRLIIVFLTILPLLTGPVLSDCENSEDQLDDSSGGATFNETHELSEAEGGGTLEEEAGEKEEEEEESEDAEEAFNDLEDETMLCADYVPQTRNKRLPDAIIIGARKVNTNHVMKQKEKRAYLFFEGNVWFGLRQGN